jgi:hypothetical protein
MDGNQSECSGISGSQGSGQPGQKEGSARKAAASAKGGNNDSDSTTGSGTGDEDDDDDEVITGFLQQKMMKGFVSLLEWILVIGN